MIYPIIFIIWSAFVLWYCLREFHKDLGQRNVSNHKTVGHGSLRYHEIISGSESKSPAFTWQTNDFFVVTKNRPLAVYRSGYADNRGDHLKKWALKPVEFSSPKIRHEGADSPPVVQPKNIYTKSKYH